MDFRPLGYCLIGILFIICAVLIDCDLLPEFDMKLISIVVCMNTTATAALMSLHINGEINGNKDED